jgi:hypothetical protein
MAILAKALATAVAGTGVQAAVDLTAMSRSITVQTIMAGTTPDFAARVRIEGSLDNANFFGLGESGPGNFNNDGDVIQYVRANILSQAAGSTCTVYCAYTPG